MAHLESPNASDVSYLRICEVLGELLLELHAPEREPGYGALCDHLDVLRYRKFRNEDRTALR